MTDARAAGRRPSLQREGHQSLVNCDGGPGATVQAQLDRVGVGVYHYVLLLGVGGALMSECIEMGSVAPMHTAFSRVFNLTHRQRAALPLVTFAGSGVGLLLAGPICDWRGRKAALVSSLAIIAAAMLATAALPSGAPAEVLLALRFVSGLAAAIQVPAGFVLAVESCPVEARSHLVFGIQFLGSFGYLLEAVGVQVFMPEFGEEPSDHWRAFCALIGFSALAVLPLTIALYESPSFLAVRGDAEGCVAVLEGIARHNGARPAQEARPSASSVASSQPRPSHGFREVFNVVWQALESHWPLLLLLSVIDSCRSFFVSGSSYLWKDLFSMAEGRAVSPAALNVIASLAPLVGLLVSERLLWIGVRRITFLSAASAAAFLATLTHEGFRVGSTPLLICVMATKLTYGPLSTCIALIKAESFPTEVRVSAFSLISVVAKVACTLAPTLVEAWKGDEQAESWRDSRLSCYLLCLAASAATCGALALFVPVGSGEGQELKDFVEDDRRIQRASNYGSFGNIWELAGEEEEAGGRLRLARSKTLPSALCEQHEGRATSPVR